VESSLQTQYVYDLNGNLISQKSPEIIYTYDALNRLTNLIFSGNKTEFIYDAFNRCLFVKKDNESKQLFYLYDHEIGGYSSNKVQEAKIPDPRSEKTFAIELGNQGYFPLQDYRYNISALRNKDGTIAQWRRYLAYGDKQTYGDLALENPWGFSNRREVSGLMQFTHRYYNPTLMRWLIPDPLDFEDGLNLYNYVRNNPFKYRDPDGCFAFLIPVFTIAFSAAEITFAFTTMEVIVAAALTAGTTYLVCEISDKLDNNAKLDDNEKKAKEERKKQSNGQIKRHSPDQAAISELVKEAGNKGVSNTDADTLLDWSKEYHFPARDDRGKPPHWLGGEHIHIGPKHVPVQH